MKKKKRQEPTDSNQWLSRDHEVWSDFELGEMQVYIRLIKGYPLLTAEQEQAFARAFAKGDEEAFHQLIVSNLRLVYSIARRYAGRGVPLFDLLQAGNLGLIRAAEKFKPELGYRFSTYAVWWIRQAVLQAVFLHTNLIHIPGRVIGQISKMNLLVKSLSRELGREPSPQEIANKLGCTKEYILELQGYAQIPLSLDALSTEENDGPRPAEFLMEMIQLDDLLESQSRSDFLEEVLSPLKERDREILLMRYGIKDGTDYTAKEIAQHFGIGSGRVHQLLLKAFGTLRARFSQYKRE